MSDLKLTFSSVYLIPKVTSQSGGGLPAEAFSTAQHFVLVFTLSWDATQTPCDHHIKKQPLSLNILLVRSYRALFLQSWRCVHNCSRWRVARVKESSQVVSVILLFIKLYT